MLLSTVEDPFRDLLRHISGGNTYVDFGSPLCLQSASEDSLHRKLAISCPCKAGSSLAVVPWPHALTSAGSIEQLERYERCSKGLLLEGVQSVNDLLKEPRNGLLPSASAWVLLLALHLLCQLRDPRSWWSQYVKLLPAPPESRMAAVCSAGPPATDLLLFSTEELERLQNPVLELAVRRERLRLTRLHAHLFRRHDGSKAKDPEVGLDSFIWAHCLVRSRALDLTGTQEEGQEFHERCMLPVIDLCNHDGVDATCRLSVRLSSSGVPRAVDLVATRDLTAGSELTLNYGARPMRDMLRGYGFTPAKAALTDPSEVYEDIGEACEALIVQGSGKGSLFRLREVMILGDPGVQPLLELAGRATICYVVQDEAFNSAESAAEAPALILKSSSKSEEEEHQGHEPALSAARQTPDEGDAECPPKSFGGRSAPALQPEAERAAALRLAGLCHELCTRLAQEPGAGPQSMSLSQQRRCAADSTSAGRGARTAAYGEGSNGSFPASGHKMTHTAASSPVDKDRCSGATIEAACISMCVSDDCSSPVEPAREYELRDADVMWHAKWQADMHRQMAEQYRLQRKLLLQRVAADLHCQACLASS